MCFRIHIIQWGRRMRSTNCYDVDLFKSYELQTNLKYYNIQRIETSVGTTEEKIDNIRQNNEKMFLQCGCWILCEFNRECHELYERWHIILFFFHHYFILLYIVLVVVIYLFSFFFLITFHWACFSFHFLH